MTEWEPYDPGQVPPAAYCPAPSYRPAPAYQAMAPVPWQPPFPPPKSDGSWRRVSAVAAIAFVLVVLAGAFLTTSRTTSGHGTALADTSLDITVHTLPNGDVDVTYPSGHFRATFPAEPTPHAAAQTIAGVHLSLHVAAESDPSRLLVGSMDLSEPVPSSGRDDFFRGAVEGLNGGAFTVVNDGPTTFQGHPGRRALFRLGSGSYRLLIFLATSQRAFVILAPAGAAFDKVAASFVALP